VKVLIDTSIWSLALRRKSDQLSDRERTLLLAWSDLITNNQSLLVGPVRQEILSGIREETVFNRLSEYLRNFEDEPTSLEDYEEAARFHYVCRTAGVSGSPIDFLICALARRNNAEIFTTDKDFNHYVLHLPIRLYKPRSTKPK
jgi:predicted nucleic acid-binding protein